ncbi:MAG: glycosyltransferase [Bacteroidia bacterium]
MRKYILEKESKVRLPEGVDKLFGYSDGEDSEDYLFNTIQNASDISLGSEELNSKIIDWASRYHLSALRTDILRPLSHLLKGDILEIGSGCGAITRFIGETGGNLFALEGSKRRANITASRCRDLSNVKVFCDNFQDFETNLKFDVITLIGVLEYSQIFINSEDPINSVLKKAKSYLKPQGILIIAIQNQLGLKYLAGAPEDHLGEKYVGIENKYSKNGPITFGKKTLENYLKNVGLKQVEFLFPFPDYKFPAAIITETGCFDKNINLPDILRCKIKYIQNIPYLSSFDEEKALTTIVQNGLMEELANSFLIVTSLNNKKNIDTNILGYTFSNQRKKEFCKQNKFIKLNNDYLVLKERTYSSIASKSLLINHVLADETYIKGNLYINGLRTILGNNEWNINNIFIWAKAWMDFLSLKSISKDIDGMPVLDGQYFDAAPFNILASEQKVFELFDLEWKIKENLRLDYIIFRSLYYSLASISNIARSANTYDNITDIVIEIINLYFTNENPKDILSFEQQEQIILNEIFGNQSEKAFQGKVNYSESIEIIKESNSQNALQYLHLIENIIEPKIQIFWAEEDGVFTELNSKFSFVKLNNLTNRFNFHVTLNKEQINYVRFDIAAQVGVLNIHDILIQRINGEVIWNWNVNEIMQKNDLFLIENNEHFNDKIVQLSLSEDPYFIIKLPNAINRVNDSEIIIEIALSSLNNKQIQFLYKSITKPLSFYSSQDILAFESEKNSLSNKVNSLNDTLFYIQNENVALNNNLETKEKYLSEVAINKSFLENELNFKNDIINKIIIDKENYLKALVRAESANKQLSQEKASLISEKALLVSEIILKNEQLIENQQNEKELLKNVILIHELSEKVKLLNTEILNKDLQISTYTEMNQEIEKSFYSVKQVNEEKTKVIKNLEKTIEITINNSIRKEEINLIDINEIKKQLTWYKNTYENRSIFGILKDKIFTHSQEKAPKINTKLPVFSEIERQIHWYKDTYENRALIGIIKDRVFTFLKNGNKKKIETDISLFDKRIQWYKNTYENRALAGIIKDRALNFFKKSNRNNVPVIQTKEVLSTLKNTSTNEIKVSVIIPTFNRSSLLPKVLASWNEVNKVTKYKYEIIFSDDGSNDNSIHILQSEKELPIKIIQNTHGGASKARNSAIQQAKGEKLLIIGDDIFPNPQIINQHYEKLLELPINKAVLGEVIWHKDLEVNTLMKHITELGNEQFSFNAFNPNEYIDFRHFYTCNISIDKAFVKTENIAFDESFYKYGFEDIELGYRLAKKGMEIYYFPNALAEHYHSYNMVSSFCKRQENAGEMAIVFKDLHGEEIEWVVQVDSILKIWHKNLNELDNETVPEDFLKKLVALCQYIEDFNKIEKQKIESHLSEIYKVIFRFGYEKGVIHKKLNLENRIYDKVFHQYYFPTIIGHVKKLSDIIDHPSFTNLIISKQAVKLVIQANNLHQINKLREYYKSNLDNLKFILPSEANNLSDHDFVYYPEQNYLIHFLNLNQIILFLQTFPSIDAIILSFGLNDFPEIGISSHINNNIIYRNRTKSSGLNNLKNVKIIRLISEKADKIQNWNILFGENKFKYDTYGFLFKQHQPKFQEGVFTIKKQDALTKNNKTVFVFPTFLAVGGVEKNTVEIINHLNKEYNFIVVNFEQLVKAHGSLHKPFLEACNGIYDLTELSTHENILNYLKILKETYSPDLIWICNGSPWLASHTSDIRALFNDTAIVDQQVYDTSQGWVQLYKKRDAGLLNFDRFIAINSKIREVFIEDAEIDPENIDLIYSAISTEKRKQAILKSNTELRKKYNLEISQKYFVFIGRLTKQKSPLDLLKLIKLIVAKYNNEYKFIIVGSGELGLEVEKYISDNNLCKFVIRYEFIENTFEISKISEAIMFTSLYEGLSIALLEAISIGTPAISTDVGDTKLILEKYGNGLVFPAIGDINSYFEGFEKFLEKNEFFTKNAEKHKNEIAEIFSPLHIASQYSECFENAMITINCLPA